MCWLWTGGRCGLIYGCRQDMDGNRITRTFMTNAPTALNSNPEPSGQENDFTTIRLASTAEEIAAAQRLRYAVFYEEYGAKPSAEMAQQKRDFDRFDDIADHLIVLHHRDGAAPEIVGTYRLLRQEIAEKHGGFYSAQEYDLSRLLAMGSSLLELGRSCVLAEFRTKPILNLLWQGIADYVSEYEVDFLFGCASFPGTDVEAIAEQLSYLHHFHQTPGNLRPRALAERYVEMNRAPPEAIDEKRAFASLPPLIKGYLRAGATIGDGAVVDHQWNSVDVCIVAQTKFITDRYRKYYTRKIQKTIPGLGDEAGEPQGKPGA